MGPSLWINCGILNITFTLFSLFLYELKEFVHHETDKRAASDSKIAKFLHFAQLILFCMI